MKGGSGSFHLFLWVQEFLEDYLQGSVVTMDISSGIVAD